MMLKIILFLFFFFLFLGDYARIIPDNVLIYFLMNNKKYHDDTIIYLSNSVKNSLYTYASVCLHLHCCNLGCV